jgi:hypothetical protein
MHAVPQQNLREAKNLVEVMPMTFLDRRRTFEQKAEGDDIISRFE